MKNRNILLAAVMAAICFYDPSSLLANEGSSSDQNTFSERTLMTRVILKEITIWVKPSTGEPVYAAYCRNLPHSCEEQISQLVDYIYDASSNNDLDPWLLAAIAWHESRFNPFVIGSVGEAGIFQINPRSPKARGMKFVHSRWYRAKCRNKVGACQKPIVKMAAEILVSCIEQCDTTWDSLRMYNSGRCDGPRRYPRRIFRAKKSMLKTANEISGTDIQH